MRRQRECGGAHGFAVKWRESTFACMSAVVNVRLDRHSFSSESSLLAFVPHLSAVRPLFGDGPDAPTIIKGGRHPILERLLGSSPGGSGAGGSFVPNDVAFGSGCNLAVLTGPNCSGEWWYNAYRCLVPAVTSVSMADRCPALHFLSLPPRS